MKIEIQAFACDLKWVGRGVIGLVESALAEGIRPSSVKAAPKAMAPMPLAVVFRNSRRVCKRDCSYGFMLRYSRVINSSRFRIVCATNVKAACSAVGSPRSRSDSPLSNNASAAFWSFV